MPVGAAPLLLSIVIPTYDRRLLVRRSIDSALDWRGDRADIEILVVDDGSTDGTLDDLKLHYPGTGLRLLRTPSNLGASGAKNFGASEALGDWVMFLDSDDVLIAGCRNELVRDLGAGSNRSVIFFRCRDMHSGRLIGEAAEQPVDVDARTYLTDWRWGECLPVVNRAMFRDYPYEARLRGHEGIAYARLFKHSAPGRVSPTTARLYDATGDDRLSTRSALLARSELLARGYTVTLREFYAELGWRHGGAVAARILFYGLAALSTRIGLQRVVLKGGT